MQQQTTRKSNQQTIGKIKQQTKADNGASNNKASSKSRQTRANNKVELKRRNNGAKQREAARRDANQGENNAKRQTAKRQDTTRNNMKRHRNNTETTTTRKHKRKHKQPQATAMNKNGAVGYATRFEHAVPTRKPETPLMWRLQPKCSRISFKCDNKSDGRMQATDD